MASTNETYQWHGHKESEMLVTELHLLTCGNDLQKQRDLRSITDLTSKVVGEIGTVLDMKCVDENDSAIGGKGTKEGSIKNLPQEHSHLALLSHFCRACDAVMSEILASLKQHGYESQNDCTKDKHTTEVEGVYVAKILVSSLYELFCCAGKCKSSELPEVQRISILKFLGFNASAEFGALALLGGIAGIGEGSICPFWQKESTQIRELSQLANHTLGSILCSYYDYGSVETFATAKLDMLLSFFATTLGRGKETQTKDTFLNISIAWYIVKICPSADFSHEGLIGKLMRIMGPLVEDLIPQSQVIGLTMLEKALALATPTEISWHADVLAKLIQDAMTARDAAVLGIALRCLTLYAKAMTSQEGAGGEYPRVVSRLLEDMQYATDLQLKFLYIDAFSELVVCAKAPHSLAMVRHLALAVKVLSHGYLRAGNKDLAFRSLVATEALISACWLRVKRHKEAIYASVIATVALYAKNVHTLHFHDKASQSQLEKRHQTQPIVTQGKKVLRLLAQFVGIEWCSEMTKNLGQQVPHLHPLTEGILADLAVFSESH